MATGRILNQELLSSHAFGALGKRRSLEIAIFDERKVMRVRSLGIALALVTFPLLRLGPMQRYLYVTIALAGLYNLIVQFLLIPYRPQWLLKGQVMYLSDIILASMAILVTGGLQSPMYGTYFLVAVLVAMRSGGRATAVALIATFVSYSAVVFGVLATPLTGANIGELAVRVGWICITAFFVGVVVDRTRHAEQVSWQEIDQAHKAFSNASAALGESLELEQVISVAAQQALSVMDADYARVQMLESTEPDDLNLLFEGGNRTPHPAVAFTDRGAALRRTFDRELSPSEVGQDVKLCGDGEVGRLWGFDREREDCGWVVLVPLRYGSKALAVLVVAKMGAERDLTETQENLLTAFSNRVAAALTNASLYTRAKYQAITDTLTGLGNHRFFQVRFQEEVEKSRKEGRPLTLLMMDLDHFKEFNDSCGHPTGDFALQAVAHALQRGVGDVGTLARYGGDEFVAILPGKSLAQGVVLAEKLATTVKEKANFNRSLPVTLTLSVGVASYPENAVEREGLLSLADLALYLAKNSGGNQVRSANELAAADSVVTLLTQFMSRLVIQPGELGPGAVTDLEKTFRQLNYVQELGHADADDLPVVKDELIIQTVTALAATIDAKDPYTKDHSQNVTRYACALAQELGWSPSRVQELKLAALMHDIGKIGVPDSILKKPGPLTPEERAVLNEHPAIGARILAPIARLKPLLGPVRHHHERFDGTGYPDGLAGEQIPLEARVLTVADAYDAITSDRVYRKARPPAVALSILQQEKGSQFDPVLVDAFERVVAKEFNPTLKLLNGRSAVGVAKGAVGLSGGTEGRR